MNAIQHTIENARTNIKALGDITARALQIGDLNTATACAAGVVRLNEQIDAWRKELSELQPQSASMAA